MYQYLPLNEALEFTGLNKDPFLEIVTRGHFTPCFLCNISISENTDQYENAIVGLDSGKPVKVHGSIPFVGYITIDRAEILGYLRSEEVVRFKLSSVFIKEILSENIIFYYEEPVSHFDYIQGNRSIAQMRWNLDMQQRYYVSSQSSETILASNECVFPRSELQAYIDSKQPSVEQKTVPDTQKIADKDIFKLVIPVLVRYIRHRDKLAENLGSKAGKKGTIKSLVRTYINDKQNGLESLSTNFEGNWKEIMLLKTDKSTLLDKIFEEKIN